MNEQYMDLMKLIEKDQNYKINWHLH